MKLAVRSPVLFSDVDSDVKTVNLDESHLDQKTGHNWELDPETGPVSSLATGAKVCINLPTENSGS